MGCKEPSNHTSCSPILEGFATFACFGQVDRAKTEENFKGRSKITGCVSKITKPQNLINFLLKLQQSPVFFWGGVHWSLSIRDIHHRLWLGSGLTKKLPYSDPTVDFLSTKEWFFELILLLRPTSWWQVRLIPTKRHLRNKERKGVLFLTRFFSGCWTTLLGTKIPSPWHFPRCVFFSHFVCARWKHGSHPLSWGRCPIINLPRKIMSWERWNLSPTQPAHLSRWVSGWNPFGGSHVSWFLGC